MFRTVPQDRGNSLAYDQVMRTILMTAALLVGCGDNTTEPAQLVPCSDTSTALCEPACVRDGTQVKQPGTRCVGRNDGADPITASCPRVILSGGRLGCCVGEAADQPVVRFYECADDVPVDE